MTDISEFNTKYPINGTVKSSITDNELSAGGEIFILNDARSPFGYGLMYIDRYGNESMMFMTRDAYHKLVGEMVRWMK